MATQPAVRGDSAAAGWRPGPGLCRTGNKEPLQRALPGPRRTCRPAAPHPRRPPRQAAMWPGRLGFPQRPAGSPGRTPSPALRVAPSQPERSGSHRPGPRLKALRLRVLLPAPRSPRAGRPARLGTPRTHPPEAFSRRPESRGS